MAASELLSVTEIREYASDYAPNNYLIDGEEFTDTYITLCRDLAVDEWNIVPPLTQSSLATFPSKSILLYGTLWKMMDGKALLLARNTMSYSDGGLQIPIEERSELYKGLARDFQAQFTASVRALKTHLNMEAGWGYVSSDEATLPLF